jgi:hypothetical protein
MGVSEPARASLLVAEDESMAADISTILALTTAIKGECKTLAPTGPMSVDEIVALQPAAPVVPEIAARPCTRCGGSGTKPPYGKCFRCEGDGQEPDAATARARWAAGQKRKEKAAKRRTSEEQQCVQAAGLGEILALNQPALTGTGTASAPVAEPAPVSEPATPANEQHQVGGWIDAPTTTPTEIAAKLRIADAVLSCGSPEGMPTNVREALLAYYMTNKAD